MSLAPGTKLGPYEILALIGKGGMGEVYRARDTRLNRDVAIKVSKEQFTERFAREWPHHTVSLHGREPRESGRFRRCKRWWHQRTLATVRGPLWQLQQRFGPEQVPI